MFSSLFWKKVWAWTKHHWQLLVIILGVAVAFFIGRRSNDGLVKLMENQKESYEKEINLIKEVSEEKEAKKEQAVENHKKKLEEIEKQHDSELEDLKKEKQKEIEETTENYKDTPDALAKRVASALSAEYIKSEWEKKKKQE